SALPPVPIDNFALRNLSQTSSLAKRHPRITLRPQNMLTNEAVMAGTAARKATKAEFDTMGPQGVTPRETTWVTRGGNFAVMVSRVQAGAVIERADDPEEHMVIVPPDGPTLGI